MDFRVETHVTNNKKVFVVPEINNGHFIVDLRDKGYGKRVVDQIEISALSPEDKQEASNGNLSAIRNSIEDDSKNKSFHRFIGGLVGRVTIDIPHSSNLVTLEVNEFQEVAPYAED